MEKSFTGLKLHLIHTGPLSRGSCAGAGTAEEQLGVFVLSAIPTPCTGTRFTWSSPKSQECIKIKWISKPYNANKPQRRIWLLCFIHSGCLFKAAFFFYFLVSVTINVGHLQRWKRAASSVNQSLQQRDKEIITNSLSKEIIVATL